MIDFYKLPERIKMELREAYDVEDRTSTEKDATIAHNIQYDSAEEVINTILSYQGIINYTSFILMLVDGVRSAEAKK